MNDLELTCPCCGTLLQVNEDVASFDCPVCHSTIVIGDSNDEKNEVRETRSNLGNANSAHTHQNKKTSRTGSIVVAAILVGLIGTAPFLWNFFQEISLKSVEKEVYDYIDDGSYDRAKTKLESMVYAGWSKTQEQIWAGTRERLDEEIKEAKEKQNKAFYTPLNAKDCKKMTYEEIANEFRKAGFTDIQFEVIQKKKNKWLGKAESGEVKEVSISADGKTKTSFKEKELFPASATITISYYDFSKNDEK